MRRMTEELGSAGILPVLRGILLRSVPAPEMHSARYRMQRRDARAPSLRSDLRHMFSASIASVREIVGNSNFCFVLASNAKRRSLPPAPTPIPLSSAPVPKRKPKPLIALPNYDEVTSTRLQIFLDNNNFGPGKIDGKMGEFFRKALVAYKIAHGMSPTGAVDSFLAQVPEPFTNYTIKPDDEKFVGPAPTKPSEQAKLKTLIYGSFLEFVAERFHSAEEYVQKLNPGLDMEKLKPGDTVKVQTSSHSRSKN